MIECRYPYDEKQYIQMVKFHHRNYVWITGGVFAVLLALTIMVFALGQAMLGIIVLVCSIVFLLAMIAFFFSSYRQSCIQNNSLFRNTDHYLGFDESGMNQQIFEGGVITSQSQTPYRSIYKIIERQDVFYILLNKNTAIVLPKSGICNGTTAELRAEFRHRMGTMFKAWKEKNVADSANDTYRRQ